MIISKNSQGNAFVIKTKQASVEVSRSKISIGDFEITQPGEYDVSSVSCDVVKINGHLNSLIESEFVLIGALDANSKPEELTEDFTKIAILLLFVDKVTDLKNGTSLVDRVEPQIVFYLSGEDLSSSDVSGLEKIEDNLKITSNDLVFDGTRHVVLI